MPHRHVNHDFRPSLHADWAVSFVTTISCITKFRVLSVSAAYEASYSSSAAFPKHKQQWLICSESLVMAGLVMKVGELILWGIRDIP